MPNRILNATIRPVQARGRVMLISERVKSQFESDVRRRGEVYHRERRVTVRETSRDRVVADVRGGEVYRVTLFIDKKGLGVKCNCPYFDEWGLPCKHLWALILVAEEAGLTEGWFDSPGSLRKVVPTHEPHGPDEYDDLFDDDEPEGHEPPKPAGPVSPALGSRPGGAGLFPGIEMAMRKTEAGPRGVRRSGQRLYYLIEVQETISNGSPVLGVYAREQKVGGGLSKLKPYSPSRSVLKELPDADDRRLVTLLLGAQRLGSYDMYTPGRTFLLEPGQAITLLSIMCGTGRCLLRRTPEELEPAALRWDGDRTYVFWLVVSDDGDGGCHVGGEIRCGDERVDLSGPVLLIAGGLVFFADRVARLNDGGAFVWIAHLRQRGPIAIHKADRERLVGELLRLPVRPPLDLPEDMHITETTGHLRCRLVIKQKERGGYGYRRLDAELSFEYEGAIITHGDSRPGAYVREQRLFILRDGAAERVAEETLGRLGFKYRAPAYFDPGASFELASKNLPRAVRELTAAGWMIEAEGKLYRQASSFSMGITSGVDWFDLNGSAQFGDLTVPFPRLLQSLRKGEGTVVLDDGTIGVLPEEWLRRYATVAGMGRREGDALRFTRAQAGFLDALLAVRPEVTLDEAFSRARDELKRFESIAPVEPPPGFRGTLRGYQKDGVGWFDFLRRFGFGGCLADDMGLGKTVMVLALLEARRAGNGHDRAGTTLPSLVVVPRSLVFNWQVEAGRFSPGLRILDHTGITRRKDLECLHACDVVLTTYGTMRRDAGFLKDMEFDYVVLDEAQAIKNAGSETAKAARLLRGRHRLALSGTPIENHLGELWSLCEFLNPGMMGAPSIAAPDGAGLRNPDEETRRMLSRALRPFILRRTKEQVAGELPPKHEQVLYCELEQAQRTLYDELRGHYRASLLAKADEGMGRMTIHILEALLRLRQAAIHPGLIDKSRTGESSAKLDMLLPQVEEVIDGGHKALIFSQFTSMLAIVRDRLDRAKVRYAYLDGRTRDRQAKVDAFQNDSECRVFLISIKAGGLGLNLTAADYVYLLDPWWNPAVEAQAVDRAHRIGQTRQVFTYRLIARDTVEEKIQELQKSKRDLAASIVTEDNSLIRTLTRDDLEALLS